MKRYEGLDVPWSGGLYSWRTNRAAFFDSADSEPFREGRRIGEELAAEAKQLREQIEALPASDTRGRLQLRDKLRQTQWRITRFDRRIGELAGHVTGDVTRHEVTHQLFFNSGVQKRGRGYPFWLSEGLAGLFE